MITIFTPSFADEADTNAQNHTGREVVSRLDPECAEVTMLHEAVVDPRILSRPKTRLLHWRKHGNTPRILWEILRNVPDVYFHPREGPLDATFLNLRRHLNLKTALVTPVVSGGLESSSYSPRRVRNIREADAVVANNTHLAELVKDKFGVDAGIIYDGIDRRYFFPPESGRRRRDSVSVLYAGSMRPYKRVPVVVREAVRWPQVHFRIAGIGEEEKLCKSLAAELKCRNVEFLGHLPQSQLGDEMRRADILFFPSILEGHPQVLGQAAASGLPAVASRVYRPDYVINGTTGFLVDTDIEFSEKLDCLIRQPNLRRAMGDAAAVYSQKFDWDIVAQQWQDVFERAVAKRRKH